MTLLKTNLTKNIQMDGKASGDSGKFILETDASLNDLGTIL